MSQSLQLTERAAKQLDKLHGKIEEKILDLQGKFLRGQVTLGKDYKKLTGYEDLYSARLGDYRCILLHNGESKFAIIHIGSRADVYERLQERLRFEINSVTGHLEVIDLDEVETKLKDILAPGPSADTAKVAVEEPGVLDGYTDDELSGVGVARVLHPSLRSVKDESGLLRLVDTLDTVVGETLMALASGQSLDEVMERITDPARPDDGEVDTTDLRKAIDRTPTASQKEVERALKFGFDAWRTFLHPSQKTLVKKEFRGPARVSGGPGTGKTVVLLHRAIALAKRYETGKPILVTTYNRFLADHLRTQLDSLDAFTAQRIEVATVDKIVFRAARERDINPGRALKGDQEIDLWKQAIAEAGGTEFSAEFCRDEFTEVVCGNSIEDRDSYLRVRRAGRSHRLSRAQRLQFWKISQRFISILESDGCYTYDWLSARMAPILAAEADDTAKPFQHVLIDEAQDVSAAQWRVLRALVPEGKDDMFIAGDTFQRIYGVPLALGPLGIEIRGRSRKLRLNYRTTREILDSSLAMMAGESYDDLDSGTDSLAGYRSVMSGMKPILKSARDDEAERKLIVEQIHAIESGPNSVAVCTPSKWQRDQLSDYLKSQGIKASSRDDRRDQEAVLVTTMHSLKGLEFQHIIISGIGAGTFPRQFATKLKDINPSEHRRQMRKELSLLFVASTRARDTLTLTWSGEPSMFLKPLLQD